MFGNKELKEKAFLAESLNEKLNNAEDRLNAVNEGIIKASGQIDEMEADAKSMDSELTKIVDYAKSSEAAGSSISERVDNLTAEIEKLDTAIKETDEFANASCDGYGLLQDNLTNLMEESKTYTGITKKLQSVVDGYLNDSRDIILEAKKMQSLSHDMSTLALNSAIEAGRLGEAGLKYVKAADDIRAFADNYTESADKVSELADKLLASYEETNSDIRRLISMLKDNNKLLSKMANENAEYIDNLSITRPVSKADTAASVVKEADDIKSELDEIMENQRLILEGMESIGASYMKSTDSREKLKEILNGFKDDDITEEPANGEV